eukprot:5144-Eustigmatos_ZCMA.PRE.1
MFNPKALRASHALFGVKPYIIGVTGGSSTAGAVVGYNNTWANRYHCNLRALGFNTELRNGAQGTTPTVITSPCIRFL